MDKNYWVLERTEPSGKLSPEEEHKIAQMLSKGVPAKNVAQEVKRSLHVIYKIKKKLGNQCSNIELTKIQDLAAVINSLTDISKKFNTDSIVEVIDKLKDEIVGSFTARKD